MFQVNGQRIKTWNPLGGECGYHCPYCWARRLISQKKWAKYQGPPARMSTWRNVGAKPKDIIFVQSMSDLFHPNVKEYDIQWILERCRRYPDSTFYLLTKNPPRYFEFDIPPNCICGCTLETNYSIHEGDALSRYFRARAMYKIPGARFLSIEPIMDFNFDQFMGIVRAIHPSFVYIGYDNYNNYLPEPPLSKTQQLITRLREFTEVRVKTLREALA